MRTLKNISGALLILSVVIGILLFTGRTFGYARYMRPSFYLLGGIGLVISLVANRKAILSGEYNILFWLGNLIIFVGLVLKTYGQPQGMIIVFAGLGISMVAYFYNPFSPRNLPEEDSDPLDQF